MRARSDHPARGRLGSEERAGEVDVERVAPLGGVELQKRGVRARAGVVDEHVETTERLGELVDERLDRLAAREVEVAHLGDAPVRADLRHRSSPPRGDANIDMPPG